MTDISGSDNRLRSRNARMVALLIVAVFFSMGGRVIFSPLMPYLQDALSISLSTAGTLFLLVNVGFSVVMMFSGFLAARIGHGNTIVFALASIALGLFITGSAGNAIVLAFGMIFIGSGAGTYAPSGIAMINTKISVEKRSMAFSFHEIGPNMAMLLAPLIVLVGVPWVGWRGVLLLMGLLSALGSLAFYLWGAKGSGVGAPPNLSTITTILKLPDAYISMLMFSASLAGWQGVFAILPAYLVEHSAWSAEYVNSLMTLSRVTSIFMLVFAGAIIKALGKRNTIILVLLFTSVLTGLLSVAEGRLLEMVVICQPALIAVMFPAQLGCLAEIGEAWYQNVTTSLVVTVGMTVGAGVVPAVLGVMGDYGIGWFGFISLALFMLFTAIILLFKPAFCRG